MLLAVRGIRLARSAGAGLNQKDYFAKRLMSELNGQRETAVKN